MKRALLALVLGVLSTVGVSWTLALQDSGPVGYSFASAAKFVEIDTVWMVVRFRKPGSLFVVSELLDQWPPGRYVGSDPQALCPPWSGWDAPPQTPTEDLGQAGGAIQARGWPLTAMWCEYEHVSELTWPQTRLGLGAIDLSDGVGMRALPLRPIPMGMAVNSLAYGFAWFLALVIPSEVRRTFRRGTGRCPTCGYDLQATPGNTCPECGDRVSADTE